MHVMAGDHTYVSNINILLTLFLYFRGCNLFVSMVVVFYSRSQFMTLSVHVGQENKFISIRRGLF